MRPPLNSASTGLQRRSMVFGLLLVFAASALSAPSKLDSLKVGSLTYSNVTVLRVTETDVYFTHDKGVANAKLKFLEPELQKAFEYNPEAAARAERLQSQEASLFQRSFTSNAPPEVEKEKPFRPPHSSEDSLADPVSDKSLLGKPGPLLVGTKWLSEKPDLTGKYVLLYFWAPWSVPCRKLIPDLNAVQKRFTEKLVVIGLASESQAEIEVMSDVRIEFTSGLDAGAKLRAAVGATSIPYAVLVDPKGFVRYQGHPAAISERKLQAILTKTAE